MNDDFDKMYSQLHGGAEKPPRNWMWLIGLAVILAFVGGGFYLFTRDADYKPGAQASNLNEKNPSMNAEAAVRRALAEGDYDKASAGIERHRLFDLYSSLEDTLFVTFLFNYDQPKPAPMMNGRLQLPAGTPYSAVVNPVERCYLYLLRRTTDGQWQQLLPDASAPNGVNPIAPMEQNIPNSGRLYCNSSPGTETLYLSGSRWRQEKLEKMIQDVLQSAGREQLLLDFFAVQRQAMQRYPGIICKKYSFDHNQ